MTLDLAKLKEAAEKATDGPWGVGECSVQIHANDDARRNIVWEIDSHNREANATYISLANPATILALIERLESAETIVRSITGDPHIGHIAAARAHMDKHNARP